MLTILRYIAAGLGVFLLFGVSVLIHEAGHFLAARALGMRADVFSVGFGPAIWKRRRGGTEYRVSAIPFGGYVALPQLDPSSMSTIQGGDGTELPPAAWWKRVLVALAGPFGNIVLGILLALVIAALPPHNPAPGFEHTAGTAVGWVMPGSPAEEAGLLLGDCVLSVAGAPVATPDEFLTECHLVSGAGSAPLVVSNRVSGAVRTVEAPLKKSASTGYFSVPGILFASVCVIGEPGENSPASRAGLREGDRLFSVGGEPLFGFNDFTNRLAGAEGALSLTVLRDGAPLTVSVAPEFDAEAGRKIIGVPVNLLDTSVRQWMKYRDPWKQLRGDAGSIFRILKGLVAPKHKGEAGKVAGALNGPVMIFASIWVGLLTDFLVTLGFIRLLNVNLAILNLLPIPVLDGGHILFALYEAVFRRKISPKVLNIVVNVFAVLFLALFALLLFRDSRALLRRFF